MTDTKNTVTDADWLEEAARYFENRHTGGEDMAFWANVTNAERCRSIAQSLRASIPGGVGVKGLLDDAVIEAIHGLYLMKVREYDADFRRDNPDGFWEKKYGTNLHSTGLGEQWALKEALKFALDLSPVEGEPVAWQRLHPTQGWFVISLEDIPHYRSVGQEIRPLYAAPSNPVISDEPTHRHDKRGTEYVLIGIGKMQANDWQQPATRFLPECPVDGREVAIYRSAADPAEIWVRPREEFEDGRFEALTAALSVKPQSGER